jgi:hypothetical protein
MFSLMFRGVVLDRIAGLHETDGSVTLNRPKGTICTINL